MDNGQHVIMLEKTGGLNQQFDFRDMGGGRVEIVARHSGKCLDVFEWSFAAGAPVVQWDCHGGANQLWFRRIVMERNPETCPPFGCATVGTKFVSVLSGLCIDDAAAFVAMDEGWPLRQEGCCDFIAGCPYFTMEDAWWMNQTWTIDNEHGPESPR
jgi:Ricin-type beta-trefoil lectin domain-like